MMKRILLACALMLLLGVSAMTLVGCNTGEQTGTVQIDENGEPDKTP